MGGPCRPASQFRLYWMHPKMSLLRRFVIRAVQQLRQNPEARAKASQVLEEQVKPRAEQAWREAQPKIEHAKLGLMSMCAGLCAPARPCRSCRSKNSRKEGASMLDSHRIVLLKVSLEKLFTERFSSWTQRGQGN